MSIETSPSPSPTWASLLWHCPSRRTLLSKGPLIALALLPLATLIIGSTTGNPHDMSAWVWIAAALAVDFLLCCVLMFVLYGIGIAVFVNDRQSKLPYTFVEWGTAAFWWWLIPIFLLFAWSWAG